MEERYSGLIVLGALIAVLYALCRKSRRPQKPDGKVPPPTRRGHISGSNIDATSAGGNGGTIGSDFGGHGGF